MSIHDDGIHDSPGGHEDLQEQRYLQEFPLAIDARIGGWKHIRSNSRNYLKCTNCQKVEVGTFGVGLCAECHAVRASKEKTNAD